MRLSVLDQSPVPEGSAPNEALHHTIDLARHTEALGFHRYWLAEHHGGPMLAGPSPEVLAAAVAARTERIRVGSGGVMLPHYSPLKVAENWSLLAGLHPGRIDLGLGRAAGTDPVTTLALQRDRSATIAIDDFPQQLDELLAHLEGTLPENHPFARHHGVLPGGEERPEPWLLGSSGDSAVWAAARGLPYSFADFIHPHSAAITRRYIDTFEPSGRAVAPRVSIGVNVVCAETDEEAERLATSGRMMFSMMRQGRLIKVPTVERASAYLAQRGAPEAASGRRGVVGSPAKARARIEEIAEDYGAEEVIVVTITHDHAARRRSYELLAEAFGLESPVAGAMPSTSAS